MTDHVFGVVRAPLFDSTLQEAANNLVGVRVELNDGVERFVFGFQHAVEFGNLLGRARVAVEEKPVDSIRLAQPVNHNCVRDVIGNVLARIHNCFDLEA